MSGHCLHPGRPANARCEGCPFTDHAAATAEIAARIRELEPALGDRSGASHPCDDGCLLSAPEAAAAS